MACCSETSGTCTRNKLGVGEGRGRLGEAAGGSGDVHDELRSLGVGKLGQRQKLATLVMPYWRALSLKERANGLYRASRYAEAEEAYTAALEQCACASTDLGLTLLELGQGGEAEAVLRTAAQVAPANAVVAYRLSQVTFSRDPAQSIMHLRRACELDPNAHGAGLVGHHLSRGGLVGRVGRIEGRLALDGGLDAGRDAQIGEGARAEVRDAPSEDVPRVQRIGERAMVDDLIANAANQVHEL